MLCFRVSSCMFSGLLSGSWLRSVLQHAGSNGGGASSWLFGELLPVVGAGEVLLLPVVTGGCFEAQQALDCALLTLLSASSAALMAFSRVEGLRLLLTDFRLVFCTRLEEPGRGPVVDDTTSATGAGSSPLLGQAHSDARCRRLDGIIAQNDYTYIWG